MSRFPFVCGMAALVLVHGHATAQEPRGLYRDSPAGVLGDGAERPGQPPTISAPREWKADLSAAQFSSVYARLRSPRIVVFWNRELTDDLETEREDVTRFSADSQGRASMRQEGYRRRRSDHLDVDATSSSSMEGEIRSRSQRIDPGKRATSLSDADDFDMERGFAQALSGAGAKLVDRTAIMRADALSQGPANAQAVEMRALMGRADWTIEVTPLSDEDATYKIVVRDLSSGTIVAMVSSDGRSAPKHMPYVAGPNGFVRATPLEAGPMERGQQLARVVMASIARQPR